jgi:molecular chaperone DnaK (HSP70)/Flp pilus assembly protein TadD
MEQPMEQATTPATQQEPTEHTTTTEQQPSQETVAPMEVATESTAESNNEASPPPEPKKAVVVGIDFGTQKCVIALTKARDMYPVILRNNLANPVTPNIVSFRDQRRLIGEEGMSALARSPNSSLHSVKRLLGQDITRGRKELEVLPFDLEERPGNNVAYIVPYLDGQASFRPEQVAAMMLKTLRGYVDTNFPDTTPDTFKGCVLTVPASFTPKQRRALVDAAAIAGLKVIKVINEATAVGLCHGLRRRETAARAGADDKAKTTPPPEGADQQPAAASEQQQNAENVLFVDMGHSYLSVQLAAFTGSKMKVLSSLTDDTAGAREFDIILAKHFAEEIKQKHGIDVMRNKRAWSRLLHSAEKTKAVLSTIDDTFCEVENLSDIDFRGRISRTKFEDLSRELLQKVEVAVETVLKEAGVSVEALTAVEIVGGGTRIPAVQAALAHALAGKTLSRTLDSSGSVAVGAALMAAILTPEIGLDYVVEEKGQEGGEMGVEATDEEGLSGDEVEKYIREEAQMEERDRAVFESEHKRNEVEQLVYSTREKCDDRNFKESITDSEKEALLKKLDEVQLWIDDHPATGQVDIFNEKIQEIQDAIKTLTPNLHAKLEQLREEREKREREEAEEAAKFKAAEEKKEKQPRTKKQKIQEAAKKRNQGNLVFKEFDYESAARLYAEALNYMADLYDLSPKEQEEVNALRLPLHLNLAACLGKINRHNLAVENCNKALEIEKKNVKALFRRAQSYVQLKKLDEAKADLTAALEVEPKNGAIVKELATVNKLLQQEKDKQKKVYAKMFS